jgi:glycosyltransferase involved in cell wall biosynthesis
MPVFSVVIPLYNKEKYIQNTIESALNQTFRDFEIIVVNDGSTDSSLAIVKQIEDSRIKIFSIKNGGVSRARNFGIEKAESDLIAFLDADDYWYPQHLENLNLLISTYPNHNWFASAYEKRYSSNLIKSINSPILYKGKEWFGEVSDFFMYSFIDCLTSSSSVAIKKEFFNSLEGFDTTISHGEDTDLWVRSALKDNLIFSNQITAQYKLTSNNRSSAVDMKNRKNINFRKFAIEEKNNKNLKKYLDLNKYSLALQFKMAKNNQVFNDFYKTIDFENLNNKQLILLKTPRFLLIVLLKIKSCFEYFGIRLSAF